MSRYGSRRIPTLMRRASPVVAGGPPTLPDGAILRFVASDYDAGTGTWTDSGTMGQDATQATGSLRPTLTASNPNYNGEPTVTFAADWLRTATFTKVAQPLTIYLVGDANAAATQILLDDAGGTTTDIHLYMSTSQYRGGAGGGDAQILSATSDPHVWCMRVPGGGSVDLFVDDLKYYGARVASGHTHELSGLTIGANQAGSGAITGSIAEIIVYAEDHDAVKRGEVATYLAYTYGLSIKHQITGTPQNSYERLVKAIETQGPAYANGTFDIVIRGPLGETVAESTAPASYARNTVCTWHSASKPCVAAAMLDEVRRLNSALTDLASVVLAGSGWNGTGTQNDCELRDALAFMSGITPNDLPWSVATNQADYEARVAAMPGNVGTPIDPGSKHEYHTDNEDISGLMTTLSGGYSTWADVWAAFKTATGLFASSILEGPIYSAARKLSASPSDYADFLEAIRDKTILTSALVDEFTSDQVAGTDLPQAGQPLEIAAEIGEDWHFSFGWWLEYRGALFVDPGGGPPYPRMSTVGLGGQYCSIDYDHGYCVVIGPPYPGDHGGDYLDTVWWYRDNLEALVEAWVADGCPVP